MLNEWFQREWREVQAVVNRIGTMDRFLSSSVPGRKNGSVPETGITRCPKTMADRPSRAWGL